MMDGDGKGYWQRLTRRQLLRSTGMVAGGALAGSVLAACGGGSNNKPSSSTATALKTAAVGAASATAAAAPGIVGGKFTVATTTPPPTLDLMNSLTAATREVGWFTIEALVSYDENFKPLPVLAEKWDISPDGLTYTFPLRKGVKFHNGKEMKAEDVIASTDRFLKVTSRPAGFKVIDKYEAKDDYTVTFTLKAPSASFIDNMAYPLGYMGIFPKEVIQGKAVDQIKAADMIGTGPYTFAEFVPDQFVRYTRFKDYQATSGNRNGLGGNKTPYFDEITLKSVPETGTRLSGLQTGELDYAASLPFTAYDDLKNNAKTTPVLWPYANIEVLTFNHADPLTGKLQFRQAIQMLLDADALGKAMTNGRKDFYSLDPSLWFKPTPWHNDQSANLYNQHSVQKAKSLLQQAGYNGEEISFITNRNYDASIYKPSVTIDESLKTDLGLKTNLQVLDWPGQVAKTKEKTGWHLAVTGLVSGPTFGPEGWASYVTGSGSIGLYNSDQMNAAYDKLSKTTSVDQRVALAKEIQRIFHEEVAMVSGPTTADLSGIRSDIQGYAPWYQAPRFWNVWRKK
ncbi:MAG: ABC transporter substrate-binding protein [Dehalococcoidia bacterium]